MTKSKKMQDIKKKLLDLDIDIDTCENILKQLKNKQNIKESLKAVIFSILSKSKGKMELEDQSKPHTILVCGINGVGKTTTVMKMIDLLKKIKNFRITVGACDTFRIDALQQLEILLSSRDVLIVSKINNKDKPISVAKRAYESAKSNDSDVLIIDTAGRMYNKKDLMEELSCIVKVLQSFNKQSPHSSIIIIDANNGHNARTQVEFFSKFIKITGIIFTKLDLCTNGGIVISIAHKFPDISIYGVCNGQDPTDISTFNPEEFTDLILMNWSE